MVTTYRHKAKAVDQVAEATRSERKYLVMLRRLAVKLNRLAYKHQVNFGLRSNEMQALIEAFTEAQIETHLIAKRRVRLQVAKISPRIARSLRLAITPSLLSEVTEAGLDDLRARYNARTLEVFQNLTTKLNEGIRTATREAIESQVAIRPAIDAFFSRQGLTPNNFYYFENLLRTQTQLVYNSARWEEYQNPEIDEILWGYEYVTVGDDRVRENHAAMDGTKLPKDDPFWTTNFPPNGYNCRCQAIPLFEPVQQQKPKQGSEPDQGFEFNPGQIRIDG